MKLGVSHQRPEKLTPEYLLYLKQMGVEYLEVRTPAENSSYEHLVDIRNRVEAAGLKVFEVMLSDMYSSPKFALGLPGRDREIDFFKSFIVDLSRAGIDCTTYAWNTGGTYATGRTTTRGCQTRLFQLEEALKKPNVYDREYPEEELWENYEYFIREVLPVAKEHGVRLQLHPNDPPVTHCGVARIFRSNEAFRRAMEIADHSPYSGILFCVGCWGEMFGPDGKGEDIVGAIREFGARGHIYQVHFRNVSSPMPDFHETFPDNGYLNMYRIMKALGEVGFDGMAVPDHVPVCEGSEAGPKAGEAYIFGYIRALMQAVETELGHI
jgi:mannonate dehydratase